MPAAVDPLTPPEFEELQLAWVEYNEAARRNEIDPDGRLYGHFVAFYDRKVVGHGPDEPALRGQVAARLRVHPERLVISYIGE